MHVPNQQTNKNYYDHIKLSRPPKHLRNGKNVEKKTRRVTTSRTIKNIRIMKDIFVTCFCLFNKSGKHKRAGLSATGKSPK